MTGKKGKRTTAHSARPTRRALLAALLGLGGTGAAHATAAGKRRSLPQRRPRTVTLLEEGFLAGMAYYDFAAGPKGLRRGQPLVLRREPDNPHDPLAVAVFLPDGRKLGYLARVENEAVARVMDAGVPLRAVLSTVGGDIYAVTMRISALLPA